ncbi:uncharacterized protein KY384_004093 [Bacidia gigantensis]|uniref:uncharacterized protein n=1 Tax=Bacidia gigantensis TaxID=2732470 RepID=UPI001D03B580|nr:uncharacterized protein KY384_004093 [Bacidia gigantensis]KAG8530736.1 hypothetical protein KY384_004093 [Bacidia gigantensis]
MYKMTSRYRGIDSWDKGLEGYRKASGTPSSIITFLTIFKMMQNFLQENNQLSQEPILEPFALEQIRRDLDGYRVSSPKVDTNGWAAEYDPGQQDRLDAAFQASRTGGFVPQGFSPSEFQKFEMIQRNAHQRVGSPNSRPGIGTHGFQRPLGIGFGMGLGSMGSQYRPMNMQQQPSRRAEQSKGKGRMVELDDTEWEKQFKEMDQADQGQAIDTEARAAMERGLNQMDRSVLSDSETNLGDFESIWKGIQAETAASRTLNGMRNGEELGLHMGDDLDGILNNVNTWDAFDGHFTDHMRDPQLGNYTFEEDNPYQGTANPYEEGLKIVHEGGNLSLAALAFEAAVQQRPDHVAAWSSLGSAQAQNEKETPAIRALEHCIKLDPGNLPALMGLAISYTNEGYDSTAYRTLERWLSTKYPQIIPPGGLSADTDLGYTDRHILHEKVTNDFIRAAQLSPGGEHMDPDVQVGLGVLFYGAEEYAKAVDCFEAALASAEEGSTNSDSQAHLLWNRLGATLANSGRSEEAIDAYEKALLRNPNFVRARYNLGVSCINIGVYEQAAQHLLGALSMHRVVEREGLERVKEVVGREVEEQEVERMVAMNQSTNLLETLRRVFQSMGRRDLADKVEVGIDVEAFRGSSISEGEDGVGDLRARLRMDRSKNSVLDTI